MSGAIHSRSSQSLLAVRGIPRRSLTDEAAEVLDHSSGRSKATDAEREKHPAAGVRGLGRILAQLFAYLTVDLISIGVK